MKRFALWIALLVLTAILSACAQEATPTPTPTPTPTLAPRPCPTTLPAGSSRGLYRHEGASMRPNFEPGQVMEFEVVDISVIKRGDVIVMRFFPDSQRADGCPRDFIKRVVGLPGERIEVRDLTVLVDGIGLEEPYVAERRATRDMRPLTIPEGEYFSWATTAWSPAIQGSGSPWRHSSLSAVS